MALLSLAGLALLFGLVGPLSPPGHATGAPRALPLLLSRAALGLAFVALTLPLLVFGSALNPLLFLGVSASALVLWSRGNTPRLDSHRAATAAALVLLVLAVVLTASLFATNRDGTLYDTLSDLLLVGTSRRWAVLVLTGALCAWCLRALRGPRLRWRLPAELLPAAGLPVLASLLFALVWNLAVELPSCPDNYHHGVEYWAREGIAFDLAILSPEGESDVLAFVLREQGLMGLSRHRDPVDILWVEPLQGDLEEVARVGDDGLLLTEILEPDPATLLRSIDPLRGTDRWDPVEVPCWVSSVAYSERRGEAFLGCETSPELFAIRVEDGSLRSVGSMDVWDDAEDLRFNAAEDELVAVSLAEGDRLRWIDPNTAEIRRSIPLGGFNYSVAVDEESDSLIVARFHDSSLLRFDRNSGALEERRRLDFGLRAVELEPSRHLLIATSMFGGTTWLLDPRSFRVRRRLELGGRVKGLALAPSGDSAVVSTTCGCFRLDLDELL